MLAALGLFVFEAAFPFADLARREGWRHATADRVGARAASQYVGPGEDTLSLSGILIPEAGARYSSIDTLRALADAGDALPFLDGTGVIWGEYVIGALDTRRRNVTVDGLPRAVDFTLDLARVA